MLKRAHVWPLPRSDVITFDVVASDVVLVCVVETTLKTLKVWPIIGVAHPVTRPSALTSLVVRRLSHSKSPR